MATWSAVKIRKMKTRGKKKRWSFDRTLTPHVKVKSKVQGMMSLNKQVRNQIEPADPFWEMIFPTKMYTEAEILRRCTKVEGWKAGNVVPRADVIKRYLELVAEGEREYRVRLTPPEMIYRQTWMHFNSAKDICFLVEIDYKLEYMRKSYTYNSPFRVKEVFKKRTIQWKTPIPLVNTE